MSTAPQSPSPAATPAPADWSTARRWLLALAIVATLIVVFYTVENWRGKRAWDRCRRALEAQGEVVDWAAYIPAPVPDAQNFYKAPRMEEWFVKKSSSNAGASPAPAPGPFFPALSPGTNVVLAEVRVVAPNAPLDERADAVLRLDDPAAPARAAQLLHQALGPCAVGARLDVLLARPVEQIRPLHLVLEANPAGLTTNQLTAFFPRNPVSDLALAYPTPISYLRLLPAGSNAFRLTLMGPVYGAAEFLSAMEPLAPQFELLRQALQRPYARIDCDYQQPFGITIPNFVTLRTVAQALSERAQCELLLGQPEAAWQELATLDRLCQVLEARPSGKPLTLVGAMINVAMTGLEAATIQDGFRLHAWREPQLLALERQLTSRDLLAQVVAALKEERAASTYTYQSMPRKELAKLLRLNDLPSKLALAWIPRGWFYQNMTLGVAFEQSWLEGMDLTNRLVHPRQLAEAAQRVGLRLAHPSPYRFLLALTLPNFTKAMQTTAYNQTLVTEAALACALERYRLAQGRYPESLEALTPQFMDTVPHDLVGGQPLTYRRTEDGGYRLYSIGWNEQDDGGMPGQTREEGDWVWELHGEKFGNMPK